MKIGISGNLIKEYLKNVYFINGHSCAGKSTAVKMLAEKFDMICCGENYHDVFPRDKLSRWEQPGLCYFDTMSGWEEWLGMSPEEHFEWTESVARECVEIEILELIKLSSGGRRVIVDTNIPPDILREISDYNHVAIMLCDPPDICVKNFFKRDDPEKKFMLEQINKCKNPKAALDNFNSWCKYRPEVDFDWGGMGFFTHTRSDFETDTREEVLGILARHFGLTEE